ncbi:MAG: hypothetical protein FWF55_03245 [Treponema sp.]|nr:hypothetical protein [Treponema sp.]
MSLKDLLPQVIISWQVWAAILGLVIYMYLVGFVARTHHRPPRPKRKKKKKEKAAPAVDEDVTEVPV